MYPNDGDYWLAALSPHRSRENTACGEQPFDNSVYAQCGRISVHLTVMAFDSQLFIYKTACMV